MIATNQHTSRGHLHCGICGLKCWRGPWGLIDKDGTKHVCYLSAFDLTACDDCGDTVMELPSGRFLNNDLKTQHVCRAWVRAAA